MPFCCNEWFSYTHRILLTSFWMKSYLIVYVACNLVNYQFFGIPDVSFISVGYGLTICHALSLWTVSIPIIPMNLRRHKKVHKISKFFIRKSAFLFLAKFYGHFSKCYNEVPYLLRHRCCRLWNYHQQNIGTRRFHRWCTNSSLGMGEDRILDRRNWSSLIS